MDVKTLIHKMCHSDRWFKNDFALILAEYNRIIGDEYFFRNCLYDAVEAKSCEPLSRQVPISLDRKIPSTPPHQYNFDFQKEELLGYAKSKKLKLPIEFDDLFPNEDKPSDLIIIAVLLDILLGESATGIKNSRFIDQSGVIRHVSDNYKSRGLSKRTLENRFSEANKIIKTISRTTE